MAIDWSKELEKKMESFLENHENFLHVMGEFSKTNDSGLDSLGRLKISIFYGENTEWWVSMAERIFSRNLWLSEAEKIEAATACFDGKTWEWFQGVDRCLPVQTWRELKDLMINRFCFSRACTNSKSLLFQQEGATKEDEEMLGVLDFPSSEASVQGWLLQSKSEMMKRSANNREENYVNGLTIRANNRMEKSVGWVRETTTQWVEGKRMDIRDEIHMNRSTGLVLEIAQIGEGNLLLKQAQREGPIPNKNTATFSPTPKLISNPSLTQIPPSISIAKSVSISPEFAKPKQSQPHNRISVSELHKRMKNGLCHQCDENNSVGHNCENKNLQVVVVTDNLEEVGIIDVEKGAARSISEKTMKLKAGRDHPEIVMFDGAVILKFIPASEVQHTEVVWVGPTGYGVFLGTILRVFTQSNQSLGMKYPFSASAFAGIPAKEGIKLYAIEPHLHLEDKVDFEGRVMIGFYLMFAF